MSSEAYFQAAEQIAALLELLEVPYVIGGSLAVMAWSEPRFTRDVDIAAALRDEHVEPLTSGLGAGWYADTTSIREAIQHRRSFNLLRRKDMIKVDVFVPPDEGIHPHKYKRARTVRFGPQSQPIQVTSAEDIILQKLDWYRMGAEVSEQQWRDVCRLLVVQSDALDQLYLDEWAERLELKILLERARTASKD